jgi:hypothetical protein
MKAETCDFCGRTLVRENNINKIPFPRIWMPNYTLTLHGRFREIVSGYPPVRHEKQKYEMCDHCWENMCKYIKDNVNH